MRFAGQAARAAPGGDTELLHWQGFRSALKALGLLATSQPNGSSGSAGTREDMRRAATQLLTSTRAAELFRRAVAWVPGAGAGSGTESTDHAVAERSGDGDRRTLWGQLTWERFCLCLEARPRVPPSWPRLALPRLTTPSLTTLYWAVPSRRG